MCKINSIFNIFAYVHNVYTMSTTLEKKTYTIIVTADVEDGGFVGTCEELHAYSQGETYGEIMENIKEAVELASESSQDEFNMLIVLK